MKIRCGFVTNSSSSSFIIAFKSLPEFDNVTLEKYPFLTGYSKLIETILLTDSEYSDTRSGEIYTNIDEYIKYFVDNYGCEDDTVETICDTEEYCKEEYEKCKQSFDDGYNILIKRVDHRDDFFPSLVHELSKTNDNFIILEESD